MPGRKSNDGSYRFGFNGQEQDTEWRGGQAVIFKYRVHDPRIGKFLSVDPLAPDYPWNSPYAFAENDVIRNIDLEGAEKLNKSETYTVQSEGEHFGYSISGNLRAGYKTILYNIDRNVKIANGANPESIPYKTWSFDDHTEVDGTVSFNEWVYDEEPSALNRIGNTLVSGLNIGAFLPMGREPVLAAKSVNLSYVFSYLGKVRSLQKESASIIGDLSLGLSSIGEELNALNKFTYQVGESTGKSVLSYFDFGYANKTKGINFTEKFNYLANNVENIHFNLDGLFSSEFLDKTIGTLKRGWNDAPKDKEITIWELDNVLKNFSEKTTFYLNGVDMKVDEVKDFLKQYGKEY